MYSSSWKHQGVSRLGLEFGIFDARTPPPAENHHHFLVITLMRGSCCSRIHSASPYLNLPVETGLRGCQTSQVITLELEGRGPQRTNEYSSEAPPGLAINNTIQYRN